MCWFRRKARGKHALGAAVTGIPSGPLRVPVAGVPPVAAAPEPVVREPDAAERVAEPALEVALATLLATGKAWAEGPAPVEPAHASEPSRSLPEVPAAPAVGAPADPSSARPSLEAALAQPLPAQGSDPVLPAPPPVQAAPPRVQLGFRDGTSTALEPGSSQSLALEQLAQSLTRRE